MVTRYELRHDAELLAIILRVGIRGQSAVRLGEQLLVDFGGLTGIAQASFEELREAALAVPARPAAKAKKKAVVKKKAVAKSKPRKKAR